MNPVDLKEYIQHMNADSFVPVNKGMVLDKSET